MSCLVHDEAGLFLFQGELMTNFIFTPADVFALPIAGETASFPVRRIFCVGRNYAAHAAEMGDVVDRSAPFYFTTNPANAAHGGDALYPSGTSDYHHEVEFVVAIGTKGREIAQSDALSHIYGYGVGLDMTRRDLQEVAKDKRRPWCISKDVEAGAIFGPLTKAAAFGAPDSQKITLTKNGAIVQQSDLSLMVHNVPELLAHLSCYYTLMPGDLIMTGTPEGVGPVAVGDHLVGTVDGLAPVEARFIAS